MLNEVLVVVLHWEPELLHFNKRVVFRGVKVLSLPFIFLINYLSESFFGFFGVDSGELNGLDSVLINRLPLLGGYISQIFGWVSGPDLFF